MILTGPEIQRQVAQGAISIDPFDPRQLNPASYDLRLGDRFKIFSPAYSRGDEVLDTKRENRMLSYRINFDGFVLQPGTLYLMHTVETLCAREHVTVIDGKSSLGRLGIVVHLTAGYGDPGFRGQYTLEVTVVHPVRVYAGMRFCQARFHTVQGAVQQYDGHYTDEASRGPVPSRSWKQFEEDGT